MNGRTLDFIGLVVFIAFSVALAIWSLVQTVEEADREARKTYFELRIAWLRRQKRRLLTQRRTELSALRESRRKESSK